MTGRRPMIYANHLGTSWPKPAPVLRAAAEALASSPADLRGVIDDSITRVTRRLGIEDTTRLQITPSCTAALALAIGDLPWREGDVVVTSSLEHHALARQITTLVETRGVKHVALPYRPGVPVDPDDAAKALRAGRVRLVAVTMASNVTGEVLPVAELARLAREAGAWTLVDVAQTAGVIDVDVERLGVDLLVFAGHKGLLGPVGVGGLWASSRVLMRTPIASCGPDVEACTPFPSWCDAGSLNVAALAGLAAGIGHLERPDAPAPAACIARRERLRAGLAELPGVTPLGGAPAEGTTSSLSIVVDGVDPATLEQRLAERGVIARGGMHCAPWALDAVGQPAGTLRFSLGPQNTDDDVDAIVDAMQDIVARPG